MESMSYNEFLEKKSFENVDSGFEPLFMPDYLFDFQKSMVTWAIEKGRGAIFADCGLGKSVMELVWAQNVIQKTNGNVLLITPLAVRNRTMQKNLAHKTVVDDSIYCGVASADYLLIFRKHGENKIPIAHPTGLGVYHGERNIPEDVLHYKNHSGKQTENRYSHWIWRQYASSFWDDIRIDNVLSFKQSRSEDDEKHVHPLQLDVINRVIVLRSNPGEVVFTPFMGVGSEVYAAIINDRRGMGVELKTEYYEQSLKNLCNINNEKQGELL